MKRIPTKVQKTSTIQSTSLACKQKEICFDILQKHIHPKQKVSVAISWGADSVLTAVLVYHFFITQQYPIKNLFFIHCNHSTRSGNTEDEKFIKHFLKDTHITISTRKSKQQVSEAKLRERRYDEFKKHTKQNKIDTIIFWHNLTDRIESTFLNLLRGANINWFLAMKIQENDHHILSKTQIIRPILWLTKQEVIDICKKNKIPFVTDPSNKDTTTSLRNKLRNKILPELYHLANKQTNTTNSYIESMKNIYEHIENNNKEKKISLKAIPQSPHRNATFAYQRIIHTQDIHKENCMQIMKQLHISNNTTTPLLHELSEFLKTKTSGYKYINKTYFFKAHENIYIISAPKLFREKTIDSSKKITTLEKITREKNTYIIDKKEYMGTTIRFAKIWDSYKKKTRNQWCINEKIPIFRRKFTPILVKKNQIIKIFNWSTKEKSTK